MKKHFAKHIPLHFLPRLAALILLFSFLSLASTPLFAQEEAETEEKEQIRSRMSLTAVQGDQNMVTLKGLVRARVEGRYTGLPDLEVVFHSLTDTLEKELGKAVTDENGVASLKVAKTELLRDTADAFSLTATFEGNDDFNASDDDITITAAMMTIEGIEEDSSRSVIVRLESRGQPVEDADVVVFVRGLFNPLKVAEASTDEDGQATLDFPMDLPGESDGKLRIFAFIEDHDAFGNMEANLEQSWGTPRPDEALPRTLWSHYPPLWLLLTFIALLLIIWGHYLEVIYHLFRMRKKAEKIS